MKTLALRIWASDESLLLLAFIVGLCLLAPVIAVPVSWQDQARIGAGFVLLAVIINRLIPGRAATFFLMALSLFMTARYAYWRAADTLGIGTPGYRWFDLLITGLLFAAEVYAWIVLVLGYLQTAWPLERPPEALAGEPDKWPTVDVLIPTYNEPLSVVRPTVLAAMAMDWPKDRLAVFVLDDGVRPEFRAFAEDVGAGYITRAEHTHAKAGNLNNALKQTRGEYVAIFDCDHVPTRSFLQVTMGLFSRDPKLGLVQTPHHFYSPDPFEKNLQVFRRVPNEGALFYGVVQDGNDLWNATFFCGSCAVMRRAALEGIGGIATETVTEDAHTSLKFQRKGWNSAYLNVPQAAGLATDSFGGHIGQRIRWARGMAQIMRIDNPLTGPGLRPMQRLCYLNAMLHFFFAIPRLIFLTAPLLYLYFGIYVIKAYALAIAAYALPHLALATIANSRVQGRHRKSFWNEVYETALAPYIALPTLLAVINPRLGKFNVTAKGGVIRQSYFDKALAKPFILLFLLNVGGLVAGALRWYFMPHASTATIVMTAVWTLYNIVMISVVLGVSWETRQVRGTVRIPLHKLALIYQSTGRRSAGRTIDISEGGIQVEGGADVAVGESVVVGVALDAREYRFPAVLSTSQDKIMRFQFGSLDNKEYGQLVRILYGRADAWIGWGLAHEPDRPWRSLLQVTRLAFIGVGHLGRNAFKERKNQATDGGEPKTGKTRERPGRVAASLLWALVLMGAFAGVASHAAYAASATHVRAWTLDQLGDKAGMRLAGVDGMRSVALSIPPNRVVAAAHATVHYAVSPSLLPKISQINVLLNGQLVRSIPVTAADANGARKSVSFAVNPNLFGQYNHIGFQLIGHYTLHCENPNNSTLWATIFPTTSLMVTEAPLSVSNNLKWLPGPFFYKSDQGRLNLPFVFFSRPTSRVLQAAGIVASWFGDLANYRGTNFPATNATLPARGNAVAFATAASAPAMAGLPTIKGATLAVTTNPNDPYGNILWVLGSNRQQLVQAARALVLDANVLSGGVARVRQVVLPPLAKPDSAPRWVPSHGAVRLASLSGYNPMSVTGTGTIPFTFYLPPSLFFWNQPGVPVHVHYGYNSIPIAANSTLNLSVNSTYVHGFRLPPGHHREQRHGSVTFPASTLNPYANSMAATFYFVPIKGKCAGTDVYNAAGSIFPDSTIDLSGIPHYARLPNLAIWANGGYPFTRYADLSRTAVVMPTQPRLAVVHTFLDTLGLIGAETGYPGIRLRVVSAGSVEKVANKNLLVLTTPGSHLLQAWARTFPVRYEAHDIVARGLQGGFWDRWRDALWGRPKAPYGRKALGTMIADSGMPDGILEEAVSPLKSDRTALVIAAGTVNGWRGLRHLAASANARKSVFGTLTLVHGRDIHSFTLHAPHYYVGRLPLWTWLRYRLSNHPWAIWVFVIGVTVSLAYVVAALLRRRAARRLRGRP